MPTRTRPAADAAAAPRDAGPAATLDDDRNELVRLGGAWRRLADAVADRRRGNALADDPALPPDGPERARRKLLRLQLRQREAELREQSNACYELAITHALQASADDVAALDAAVDAIAAKIASIDATKDLLKRLTTLVGIVAKVATGGAVGLASALPALKKLAA